MRIGELLVQRRIVTAEQVATGLRAQAGHESRLGSTLVQLGYLDTDTLARALSEQHRMPAALTKHFASADPRAAARLKPAICEKHGVVPLGFSQSQPVRLIVACIDPVLAPVDELSFFAGMRVDRGVAPETLVRAALERIYGIKRARTKKVFVDIDVAAIEVPSSMLPQPTDDWVDPDPIPVAPAPRIAAPVAAPPPNAVPSAPRGAPASAARPAVAPVAAGPRVSSPSSANMRAVSSANVRAAPVDLGGLVARAPTPMPPAGASGSVPPEPVVARGPVRRASEPSMVRRAELGMLEPPAAVLRTPTPPPQTPPPPSARMLEAPVAPAIRIPTEVREPSDAPPPPMRRRASGAISLGSLPPMPISVPGGAGGEGPVSARGRERSSPQEAPPASTRGGERVADAPPPASMRGRLPREAAPEEAAPASVRGREVREPTSERNPPASVRGRDDLAPASERGRPSRPPARLSGAHRAVREAKLPPVLSLLESAVAADAAEAEAEAAVQAARAHRASTPPEAPSPSVAPAAPPTPQDEAHLWGASSDHPGEAPASAIPYVSPAAADPAPAPSPSTASATTASAATGPAATAPAATASVATGSAATSPSAPASGGADPVGPLPSVSDVPAVPPIPSDLVRGAPPPGRSPSIDPHEGVDEARAFALRSVAVNGPMPAPSTPARRTTDLNTIDAGWSDPPSNPLSRVLSRVPSTPAGDAGRVPAVSAAAKDSPPRGGTARPPLSPTVDADAVVAALDAATERDAIANALVGWLRSIGEVGLVLIVKGDVALGWRGHAPEVDAATLESVAMPLGAQSMMRAAFDTGVPFRGAPPEDGAALQTRLWKLLRCEPPREVLVAPVTLGSRTVNLVYVHPRPGELLPPTAVSDVARITAAAGQAYTRLIRAR